MRNSTTICRILWRIGLSLKVELEIIVLLKEDILYYDVDSFNKITISQISNLIIFKILRSGLFWLVGEFYRKFSNIYYMIRYRYQSDYIIFYFVYWIWRPFAIARSIANGYLLLFKRSFKRVSFWRKKKKCREENSCRNRFRWYDTEIGIGLDSI